MTRWEQIAQDNRRRRAAMRQFAIAWGPQPFFGRSRGRYGQPIVVSRELDPRRPGGSWRVTYFYTDPETGEVLPSGHTEARSFLDALRTAVVEFGFDLATAEHLPSTRPRARRDERARSSW